VAHALAAFFLSSASPPDMFGHCIR